MKTKTRAFAALAFIALVIVLMTRNSAAAITITVITEEEFNVFTTENPIIFTGGYQAGDRIVTSDGNQQAHTYELFASANEFRTGEYAWNLAAANEILLSHDEAGNIDLSVSGGQPLVSVQPTIQIPFTDVFLRLTDRSTGFGGALFQNGLINGVSIPDLLADEGSTYIRVNLGEDSPNMNLSGDLSFQFDAGGSNSSLVAYGANVKTVPEPSSVWILLPMMVIPFFRRKR